MYCKLQYCLYRTNISLALFKKTQWRTSTSALAGWQLTIGGIPIAMGAVLFEQPFDPHEISPQAYYSLGYVLAFPMIFCQWAYFKSVQTFPASIAAMSTLGIPVVGAFSSALILGDKQLIIGASELSDANILKIIVS